MQNKDMKINKIKPHLTWSLEASRGSSHALPPPCRPQQETTLYSQQEEAYTLLLQQEELRFSPCLATAQAMRGRYNAATIPRAPSLLQWTFCL